MGAHCEQRHYRNRYLRFACCRSTETLEAAVEPPRGGR